MRQNFLSFMNKMIPDQGISETIFYGDLVIYSTELLETLIQVIYPKRLSNVIKKVRYNLDIMRQSVYMVVNTITVYSYGFILYCTTVG